MSHVLLVFDSFRYYILGGMLLLLVDTVLRLLNAWGSRVAIVDLRLGLGLGPGLPLLLLLCRLSGLLCQHSGN